MILIYSKITTERLKFTLEFIFKSVMGSNFEITNDSNLFKESSIPKINYSNKKLNDCINLDSSPLLFETDINTHSQNGKDQS